MALAPIRPRIPHAWGESWTRAAVLALVTLLHLGLLAFMYVVPWTRARTAGATAESTAIEIRFIAPPPKPSAPIRFQTRPSAPPKRVPVIAVSRHVTPGKTRIMTRQEQQAGRLELVRAPVPATAGYVAGGGLLGTELRAAQDDMPVAHLPGSDKPIVAGLHMVDPRSQGISGAVRLLAGLLGATDPHCVAVDSWRSLGTQEMLDRHISPREVDRVAEEYQCKPR